eukprot:scaffold194156_cov13-Prasinocladus_malaysianus.AAC.1
MEQRRHPMQQYCHLRRSAHHARSPNTLAARTITRHAKCIEQRGYSRMVDRLQRRPPPRGVNTTAFLAGLGQFTDYPAYQAIIEQPPAPSFYGQGRQQGGAKHLVGLAHLLQDQQADAQRHPRGSRLPTLLTVPLPGLPLPSTSGLFLQVKTTCRRPSRPGNGTQEVSDLL